LWDSWPGKGIKGDEAPKEETLRSWVAGVAIEQLLGLEKRDGNAAVIPGHWNAVPPLASPSEARLSSRRVWHGYWQVFGLAGMAV
jgi:hypothetical protein